MEPFSTKKRKNRTERGWNGTWNDQKRNKQGQNDLAEGPHSRT